MTKRLLGKKEELKQTFWLWVTRPEYYTGENDVERDLVELNSGIDSDWTCHKDTRKGDLAFLWRTSPRSDLAYLFQAKSDAFNIHDRKNPSWSYACEYKAIFKFAQTLSIKEIKKDPYLADWNALRGNFQNMVFHIEPAIWDRLNSLLIKENPDYAPALKRVSGAISPKILSEEELEQRLVDNLGVLRSKGYDLELWQDPKTHQSGRQYVCRGYRGRIDLLCREKKNHRFVVIELKNVRAGALTFAQIHGYLGYVAKSFPGGGSVMGLIISRGCDSEVILDMDLRRTSKNPIDQIDLADLGLN